MTHLTLTRTIAAALTAALLLPVCASCSKDGPADLSQSQIPSDESDGDDIDNAEETDEIPAPTSDTAAFADSTAFFSLRTERKRSDPEELGVTLSYDGVELPRMGKTYLLPVEADFPAQSLLKLSVGAGAEGGTLYVDSHLLDIGISPLLSHNTRTDLCFCTEDRYANIELCFTTLPVLSADVKRSSLGWDDRECSFSLWEAKNGMLRRTDSPAAIRIRGASSSNMPKTGLKLSLKDEAGNPKGLPLLGMRRDDDWILYASYSDNTHVRDAVGWNLWRKMTKSAGLDPSGALETRWVELILGGQYDGFYLMLEPMDQKTLKLDAEKGDSLFKCKTWDVPESKLLARQNARAESFSSLDRKYPDPKEGTKEDWKNIAAFVAVCYESSGEEFAAGAEAVMDRDEILEYWLFLNLTMAADNTWKNTYYAVRDGKVTAYPWDLDITFGLGWNGDMANNFLWEEPGMDTRTYDFQAGRRLIKYVPGCGDYVRQRYETLKKAEICSSDALIADAEVQWALLHDSGAWKRNLDRWPSVSSTDSLDYFKATVRSREVWFEDYLETLP